MTRHPQLRIGISGWTYAPWRGVFFPKGFVQRQELEFASRQVNSIEINGSFYSLQRPSSYRKWFEATPDDFVFSVKCSRYITHLRRLKEIETPLANFFASGVLRLGSKLGPFLWQFPPSFRYDAKRLEGFFHQLPRTTHEAVKLARKHELAEDRAWLETDADRPLQHCIEIRHASFQHAEFIELLRKHRIALVVADTAGKWPFMEDITADFIYVRLHGDVELYASGYSENALDAWAEKIRVWSEGGNPERAKTIALLMKSVSGRSVYVYFDNDVKVHAPFDAEALAKRLGLPAPEKWPETPPKKSGKAK